MNTIISLIVKTAFIIGISLISLVLLYIIFRLISFAIAKSWMQVGEQYDKKGGVKDGKEKEENIIGQEQIKKRF